MTTMSLDATNVALLRGWLSSAPRRRELPSGSVVVELDVTTRGERGATSVPVAWFDPGSNVEALAEGDEVIVVGHVRRRFYRSGSLTQSRTEVVAQRVVPAGRRAQVTRALGELAAIITSSATPSSATPSSTGLATRAPA